MTMNTPLTDFEDGIAAIIDDEIEMLRAKLGRGAVQAHEKADYAQFLRQSAHRVLEYCLENCGSIKVPEEE